MFILNTQPYLSLYAGIDWENAWKEHIAEWKSPCVNDEEEIHPCFKSSKVVLEMNKDKLNSDYHAWSDDHFIICEYDMSIDLTDEKKLVKLTNHLPQSSDSVADQGMLQQFEGISFDDYGFSLTDIRPDYRPCKIRSCDVAHGTCDVILFLSQGDASRRYNMPFESRVLQTKSQLPVAKMIYLKKPFTSDHFVPTAFRHEIGIPDEIFPPQWKDLLTD